MTDLELIRTEIDEIFLSALSVPPPPPQEELLRSGKLDSLAIVMLLVELEEHFQIELSTEVLDLERLRTLDEIVMTVSRALQSR
jgi:acyl carrier protein